MVTHCHLVRELSRVPRRHAAYARFQCKIPIVGYEHRSPTSFHHSERALQYPIVVGNGSLVVTPPPSCRLVLARLIGRLPIHRRGCDGIREKRDGRSRLYCHLLLSAFFQRVKFKEHDPGYDECGVRSRQKLR